MMASETGTKLVPTGVSQALRTIAASADPYLLNPVTVGTALARGHYTHRIGDVRATFETDDFWKTASLLHTFRKEAAVFKDLVECLEADDVFLDVGANLGAFTCLVGGVLPDESIVALEPHPENVKSLRRNLNLNGIDAPVYQCALSNEVGSAELSVDLGRAGNQRHALSTDDAGETIEVDVKCGDQLLTEEALPRPSVVKIDVEGAEWMVVDGLSRTLGHPACRRVYCEIHPELMSGFEGTPDSVRTALEAHGFDLQTIHSSGGQEYLRGTK